jgi:hypothetical protein
MRARKSILKRSSKQNPVKFTEEEISKHLSSLQSNKFWTQEWIGVTMLKRPSTKVIQRTSNQTPEKKIDVSNYELETHDEMELEQTVVKNSSEKTIVHEKKKKFDYSFLNAITSAVRTTSTVIKTKTIRLSHVPVLSKVSTGHIPPPQQPPRRKSMFNKIES